MTLAHAQSSDGKTSDPASGTSSKSILARLISAKPRFLDIDAKSGKVFSPESRAIGKMGSPERLLNEFYGESLFEVPTEIDNQLE